MGKTVRILVTGGAGFIGSSFVKYLLARYSDYTVVNLDQLTYAGNLENLKDVETHPNYQFVHGDICSRETVEPVIANGVDAVVNFAAETHVDRSIMDAADFLRTNVQGAHVLLELARKYKVSRFVQIGTDEVYGSLGPTGHFTESSPLAPNSPYSASKAAADLMARAYYKTYHLPTIVTRCSNNYGPYQFAEKLIPLLISNALEDKPLPIYGDGLYVRDWIYVEDHSRAIDQVLHKGAPGQIYNIGARSEKTNLEIARLILRQVGKPETLITFVDDRPGHDRRYAIDSTKIETDLGWKPATKFEDGLRLTVDWYLKNKDWISNVRSGQYLNYYEKMYTQRKKTLQEL